MGNYVLKIMMIITFVSRQGMKTSKIIKTIHTSMDEIATPIKLWHIRASLFLAPGFVKQTEEALFVL